jgi:hypothetical protein
MVPQGEFSHEREPKRGATATLPTAAPSLTVSINNMDEAKTRQAKNGYEIVKAESEFLRRYLKDSFRLIYNLASRPFSR